MQSIIALMSLPLFFALLVFFSSGRVRTVLTIAFVSILSLVSLNIFISETQNIEMNLTHLWHILFIALDSALLLYFLYQGLKNSHKWVTLFAAIQIVLYGLLFTLSPQLKSSDILVDDLSMVMYMIINVVGGSIIIYSLEYIKSEGFSRLKENSFIALLFLFLAVMNFIVSTNNIEIFFMLFEMTTLFSFLLIRYRGDEVAQTNALRALWMNQIGGVAILGALLFSILHYNTLYFDVLIANMDENYLLPLALLALAAFVKGASIPFETWLLGAMVAPTPVSAILHSATMVKIAPFLILKLSAAMNDFVALSVAIFGSFVFFTASLLALSKDYFKEILGLSTIALLALMMTLASLGSEEARTAAIILIVFHAISKALLFMSAGILEKSFHLKYVNDIDGLINHSPLVTFYILIGFASLTLPPFGAFLGKFIAFMEVARKIEHEPLYILVLLFMTLGSVLLTLLYFKVLSRLFAKEGLAKSSRKKEIPKLFTWSASSLVVLLGLSIVVAYQLNLLSLLELLIPTLLLFSLVLLFSTVPFKNAQRVKEYHCGERDILKASMFYFDISKRYKNVLLYISISIIIVLIVGVL